MINTVLLDLDNTLILNPDREFALAFISKFNELFHQSLNIENVAEHLRIAIQQLGSYQDVLLTNSMRITQILADRTGKKSEQIQEMISVFYYEIYSQLKPFVTINPFAQHVIDSLLEQGITIIIATQPIYPENAVLKRLEWGNLSSFISDFSLITHSENMHSAKPSTTYYSEILNQLHVDPQSALMVGDSLKNDINPANQLGLKTFPITTQSTLSDLLDLLQTPSWATKF